MEWISLCVLHTT
ncbi:hypothetical protein OIU79_022771 [Salix purpurea]|uniref:Uncharacterized protein n=1 Tax=Salix purpurea TaxID=77065 RepID=A0A9Q0WI38_SALPP|nr:hypothetical protein OIU79_022771 [Salix purpurea]